jgi:hypothetical protein
MENIQTKEMSQIVHWSLFLACTLTLALKIVESASSGSMYIFATNPSIAQHSWLINSLI